ncbi:hypothetical protein GCM10007939_25720 [Amylibacter marinus]|uniref:Nitrogen fixation protein FixH n=1 Tax=Amylibacter marinus TaxID=1475483 RepID=A0ABQ5VYC8_9RHOB|nr:FixH family protein [Amylibacter marinus]GLQ36288.1 hypothetical protein GCM10007939_25720 [Amylibacter marinus]
MSEKTPLTGAKFAAIFITAFVVIIIANLSLVYAAVGSFPGLETRKPYVEALNFNSKRHAQEMLAWKTVLEYSGGSVRLTITDASGARVVLPAIEARLGRATSHAYDRNLTLNFDGELYSSIVNLPAGNWQLRIKTQSLDGVPFMRILPLIVGDRS